MYKLFNMSIKYGDEFVPSPHVRDLPAVPATTLKHATAAVLDEVVQKRAVVVTRHDKPRAVLLSVEEYEALSRRDPDWLADLKREYRGLLDRMQEPAQKEAARRLFEATPEELGQAALEAAQRQKRLLEQ